MRVFQIPYNHRLYDVFQLPKIHRLPPIRSEWQSCAPIHKSEATNENNITILEDLFLTQSNRTREDPWFQQGLALCAGDLKTVERMLSVKDIGSTTASRPFDRLEWLLPIPGLWHLKLNYLLMLSRVHKHPGTPVDITSLQYAIDKWDRSGLMQRENFKDMEELIIHSYEARIVGLLLRYLKQTTKYTSWKDLEDPEYRRRWIKPLTIEKWKDVIDFILQHLHSQSFRPNMYDEVWNNEVFFCRHVEPYLLLDHAIRLGDIGLLRYALGECCTILQAKERGKYKYARELLCMMHIVDSPASTVDLQNAVLANCLDNLRGCSDSYMAKDLLLELQNGALKRERRAHQTSTKSSQALFNEAALNNKTVTRIKNAVVSLADTRSSNPKHPTKVASDEVFILAVDLAQQTLMQKGNRTRPRFTLHPVPDLYRNGALRLSAGIRDYHARTESHDIDGLGDPDAEEIRLDRAVPLVSTPAFSRPQTPLPDIAS